MPMLGAFLLPLGYLSLDHARIDPVAARVIEQVALLDSPEWDALRAGDGPDPDLADLDCDEPNINIQYTSGTTGFPKGPP